MARKKEAESEVYIEPVVTVEDKPVSLENETRIYVSATIPWAVQTLRMRLSRLAESL